MGKKLCVKSKLEEFNLSGNIALRDSCFPLAPHIIHGFFYRLASFLIVLAISIHAFLAVVVGISRKTRRQLIYLYVLLIWVISAITSAPWLSLLNCVSPSYPHYVSIDSDRWLHRTDLWQRRN